MKAWMLSALAMVGLGPGRRPAPARPRASRPPRRSTFEGLERREVLSTAGAVPFATVAVPVPAAGQPAQVALHFDAGQVASDRSSTVLIGLRAVPAVGSTSAPEIAEVAGPMGRHFRVNIPRRGAEAAARALFITGVDATPGRPLDLTVDLKGVGTKAGDVALEAFLPGDVDGDRAVTTVDLDALQAIFGSAEGQANFNPAADFNFDGRIGCIDRRLAQRNLGARAAFIPASAQAAPVVPVVTVPVVAAVPVAIEPVVAVAPVAVAPVVPTVTAATAPAVVATSVQVVTPVIAQATGTAPVVVASGTQAPAALQAAATSPGTPQPAAVYYYGQPAYPAQYGQPIYASQAPVYYYGQPTMQGPAQTAGVSGSVPGAVYYYGQPVVQAPASAPAMASTPTPVAMPMT